MSRPCKRRRICTMPTCVRFGPRGCAKPQDSIVMTLDEFECIRLIDHEGMNQEQCARQMDVARTTVQAIYSSARKKLAQCLVEERELYIDGGHYVVCREGKGCPGGCCRAGSENMKNKGAKDKMKIGVTYENGQIFQHFGHTENFKIYEVQEGQVVSSQVVNTNGNGHGALAGFLAGHQVEVLICGGIGGGARNALAQAGIRLYGGVTGEADAAVEALLKGELAYNPDVVCNHHGEHHHHGEHSCGGHTCG